MSYDAKITAAKAVFEQFNTNAEEKLNFEEFLKSLKSAGGNTDEALKFCTWEDIESYGSPKKLPRLIARQIADIFRKEYGKVKVITEKKALAMSPEELLASFNPKDITTPVAQRLLDLSNGQPCLVFNDDNTVNTSASGICLADIINGDAPRELYVGADGVPQKVYRLTDKPNSQVAENPLFPGNPLRGSDESCDRTHRGWSKIPQKVRVLLRLALQSKELVVDQIGKVHDTLDLFVGKTDDAMLAVVNQRYPQAAVKYRELEAAGSLPTLKISKTSKPAKQDPFFGGHRSY